MSKIGKSSLPFFENKKQPNDNKTVDSSFVSNEIRRILNTFGGEKFKSNIVETLKCELNFEANSFPTNFIYKKLDIDKNETIIIQDIDKDIDINSFIFTVKLNKENICSIINKKSGGIYHTIKEEESKNNFTVEIKRQKLIFYAIEEIQIDSSFSIKDFNLDMFDKNEVSKIFYKC